jgi:protein disulfide-isomerase A6
MSIFAGTKVIDLTPLNFDSTGKITHPALQNKQAMIAFSANWCSYCVGMKGDYIKVASVLGQSFPLFNLDCAKYSDLATKLGVKGFPTIKYIDRNGRLGKDYTSGRTVDDFLDNICKTAQQCKR